jgi:pilus assembly protein Flp/PilA
MGAAGNSLKSNKTHFTELKEITMTSLMVSMTAFIAGIKERFESEKGATMVEYGIMVAFIAVLVMAAVIILGPEIAGLFTQVSNAIP